MKKIIMIPVAYEVNCLTKGARKAKTLMDIEEMPFEIDELVSTMEVLTDNINGITYRRHGDDYYTPVRAKKDLGHITIHAEEQEFFDDIKETKGYEIDDRFGSRRILETDFQSMKDNKTTAEHIYEIMREAMNEISPFRMYTNWDKESIEQYDVKTILSDNRKSRQNEIQQIIDKKYTLHDGVLYCKAKEPRIKVSIKQMLKDTSITHYYSDHENGSSDFELPLSMLSFIKLYELNKKKKEDVFVKHPENFSMSEKDIITGILNAILDQSKSLYYEYGMFNKDDTQQSKLTPRTLKLQSIYTDFCGYIKKIQEKCKNNTARFEDLYSLVRYANLFLDNMTTKKSNEREYCFTIISELDKIIPALRQSYDDALKGIYTQRLGAEPLEKVLDNQGPRL